MNTNTVKAPAAKAPAAEKATTVIRSFESLERIASFTGERLMNLGKMSEEEQILFGIGLTQKADIYTARAGFVIAEGLAKTKDSTAFKMSLKNEIAKLYPIEEQATRRMDNLLQSARAARQLLENPTWKASVSNVQVALSIFSAKADEETKARVLQLLEAGASQGKIRDAMQAKKVAAEAKAKAEAEEKEKAKVAVKDDEAAEPGKMGTATVNAEGEKVAPIVKMTIKGAKETAFDNAVLLIAQSVAAWDRAIAAGCSPKELAKAISADVAKLAGSAAIK